jgi:GDP-4-dehydro-6-deoxy-D-mannose reductase
MIKLLVTGLSGFVGQALQHLLRTAPPAGLDQSIELLGPSADFDLQDGAAVRALVLGMQPDWVLHLAAQSHVPTALNNPAGTLQVNVVGTANLLKALSDTGFKGRLLYISSADVYGAVATENLPVSEATLPAPRNPYAASKVSGEVLCQQWQRNPGLDVVIARPFNHTGPGQRPDFAISGFARDIAAIKLGLQPPQLVTGNLQVTRDFLHVEDVLRAYLLLLTKGQSGQIYNVCSGTECWLHDAVRGLADLAGVSVELVTDAARLRPNEQLRMCGSHALLSAHTGWQPEVPLQTTLEQLLTYWTEELKK